jgi:hypothetical protein
MSDVNANFINGLTEHHSFNCPTKRKTDQEDRGKIIETII